MSLLDTLLCTAFVCMVAAVVFSLQNVDPDKQATLLPATSCHGPDTKLGECREIKQCSSLIEQLRVKQADASFKEFLQASNRICGGIGYIVCCPLAEAVNESAPTMQPANDADQLLTVVENCGLVRKARKRIIGGEVSKKNAWPWIALLGYDEGSASPFKCGGTLITARHVLTAAHCILDTLSFVRLGEHDLTTDTDGRHVDIPIASHVKHSDYNRRNGHSDIAMLYLERNVEFNYGIQPICLPSTAIMREKSFIGSMSYVAGWGMTMNRGKSATVLQDLEIPILDNEVCRLNYAAQERLFSDNQFDKAVICAGFLSGGKDTCHGDSGGPLMIPEGFRFYLVGIVAYGIGCARVNTPGVYSSVQYFMDWITEKVEQPHHN